MELLHVSDRAVLALVRSWCVLRYPRVYLRTARRVGQLPDPATPSTDTDKFLWRKIFDHNPLFTLACDKLSAKEYALLTCPELKTAEVLWVGDDPDQIPAEVLSGSVVVKANHGSRWNLMVHDGDVDLVALRKTARSWVRRRYGRAFGEWGYINARHCLFVERMLLEDRHPIRQEYKFHVAGGRTAYVYASRRNDDGSEHKCYFERDGRIVPPRGAGARAWAEMRRPAAFEQMVTIAERLAAPFDYMRCDLYELDGDIYFSELTAYPLSGQGGSNPYLRDLRNSGWDLRKSWFLTGPQRGWRRAYSIALRRWIDESTAAADQAALAARRAR
jgi:hypothetical protein